MTHDVTTKSINMEVLGGLHNCASNYLNVDQDRDKQSPGWGKWGDAALSTNTSPVQQVL